MSIDDFMTIVWATSPFWVAMLALGIALVIEQ